MADDSVSRPCRLAHGAALRRLLAGALLLLALPGVADDGKELNPTVLRPSKYRISQVHLAPGPAGIQAAVSRGRYRVNFGTREGVQPGSIFEVYQEHLRLGLVRVERVWRDTSHVRLIRLEQKVNSAPAPFGARGRLHHLQPKLVLLQTIHFDQGKPDLSTDMHQRLRYLSRFVREFPDHPLVIEGHSDITGDEKRNRVLSRQRAEQIRQYLHEVQRLPMEQMHLWSFGSTEPIATNNTAEGRALNRRVEITLRDTLPAALASPQTPEPAVEAKK
ncbi:MAG: hypothetical protein CL928_11705 [Deltaproteobacteria bacterium]|nr:hypothetical protein [Deltaproteobacteria bacterium]